MKTVTVDAAALRKVLVALTGPGHLIRELQALRGFSLAKDDPINTLIEDFNTAVDNWEKYSGKRVEVAEDATNDVKAGSADKGSAVEP